MKPKKGIYAVIYKGREIVYIGESIDILKRWEQHKQDNIYSIDIAIKKEPEQYRIVIIQYISDKKKRKQREKELIKEYKPKYNKRHNPNYRYIYGRGYVKK